MANIICVTTLFVLIKNEYLLEGLWLAHKAKFSSWISERYKVILRVKSKVTEVGQAGCTSELQRKDAQIQNSTRDLKGTGTEDPGSQILFVF